MDRTRLTRSLCPAERFQTSLFSYFLSPISQMSFWYHFISISTFMMLAGMSILSRTLIFSKKSASTKLYPKRENRDFAISFESASQIFIFHLVGKIIPPTSSRKVVFPLPDGPVSRTRLSLGISREKSFIIC